MIKYCCLTLFVFLSLPYPTPAPVPRCSPFIIINKLAEFNNFWSDSNPYFPLPPCEYGSWQNAIAKGDLESVFVLAQPLKIPLHNFYEFIWFLKTGLPRLTRMVLGKEKLITDDKILREGYQQAGSYVRTRQLGQNTLRRPEIIDNKNIYNAVVGQKIAELIKQGPDKRPKPYTPQGPLPGRRVQAGQTRTRSRLRTRPSVTSTKSVSVTRPRTVSPVKVSSPSVSSYNGQWRPILSPSQYNRKH